MTAQNPVRAPTLTERLENMTLEVKIEQKPYDNKPSAGLTAGPVEPSERYETAYWSDRDGAEERSYRSILWLEHEIQKGVIEFDLVKQQVKAVFFKHAVKGALVHMQVDLGELFGLARAPIPPPGLPQLPCAARVGDMTSHGSPLTPGSGSPDVWIGGKPAWRALVDVHLCPFPGTPHGSGSVQPGAPTVLINGSPAARDGDFVLEPVGGPNVIVGGCGSVLIGLSAPPPSEHPKPVPAPEDLPWIELGGLLKYNLLEAAAGYEYGLKPWMPYAEINAELALGHMDLSMDLNVRIPFTTRYLELALKPDVKLGVAGVKAATDGAGAGMRPFGGGGAVSIRLSKPRGE